MLVSFGLKEEERPKHSSTIFTYLNIIMSCVKLTPISLVINTETVLPITLKAI